MENHVENPVFYDKRELEILKEKTKEYIYISEGEAKKNSILETAAEKLSSERVTVFYDNFNLFTTTITSKAKNNKVMKDKMQKTHIEIFEEAEGKLSSTRMVEYLFIEICKAFKEFKRAGVKLNNPNICILENVGGGYNLTLGIVKRINEDLTLEENNLLLVSDIIGVPCKLYCIGKKEEDKSNVHLCKGKFNLSCTEYWGESYKMKYGEKAMEGSISLDSVCETCGYPIVMNDIFDSAACLNCNVWFSNKCSDPGCMYCGKRPETPR